LVGASVSASDAKVARAALDSATNDLPVFFKAPENATKARRRHAKMVG
jgi:hypothetical protein